MNSRAVAFVRATARTCRLRTLMRSRIVSRACMRFSTTRRIGGEASSSPATISWARRANPPAALPNRTPKVRSSPRISFSSLTRTRTSTSRAGEQRADLVAGSALDADLLEPTRANDLGQGRCVVPIRLVRPHFERGVRMARIHADHGQAFCVELVPEPHGERSRLHPDPHQAGSILCKPTENRLRTSRDLRLAPHFSALVNETDCGRFLGHVERCILSHGISPFPRRTGRLTTRPVWGSCRSHGERPCPAITLSGPP